MTPHEMATICRFSRNGRVPWQSVAAILGRNAADLRAEYDSLSMTPITLEPPGIGPVTSLPEPESYRSTRKRVVPIPRMVLGLLAKGPMDVNAMAERLGVNRPWVVRCARQHLADGFVEHNGAFGKAGIRIWSITIAGLKAYHGQSAATLETGPGTPTEAGKAA